MFFCFFLTCFGVMVLSDFEGKKTSGARRLIGVRIWGLNRAVATLVNPRRRVSAATASLLKGEELLGLSVGRLMVGVDWNFGMFFWDLATGREVARPHRAQETGSHETSVGRSDR